MLIKARTFKFILLVAGMSVVASDGIAQTTARDYCNRGVARQKKGDLDGALADYSRAIEINPQYTIAYNNHGLANVAKGDLDGALADYDRALQISPRNFEIRVNRGVVRQRKGDLDGALADYDIAIKLLKTYAPAYRNRAKLKMAKNDLDGALADCTFVLSINPKDASTYYERALIKTAKGEADAARVDFNRAIKLDPKYARNSLPQINKGNVQSAVAPVAPVERGPTEPNAKYQDTGKTPELATQKIDSLSSAGPTPASTPPIEIGPKTIATVNDRDVVKPKTDEHNTAAVANSPAIELRPKTVDVRDDGNVGKATALSVVPAASNPTVELHSKTVDPSARLELGIGGVSQGKNAGAANNLAVSGDMNLSKQSHDLSSAPVDQPRPAAVPTAPNIPDEAGVAKQSKADLDSAPADRTRAAEPNNPKPPEQANVARQQDNPNRESANYSRANEGNPKTAGAYNDRAYFRKTVGDLDGALADYNHVLELSGDSSSAYYNRGVIKQAKGDLDGAIADFNPAIQLDPTNVPAYHSRAGAKAKKGDLDGALADYKRAIELNPKNAATYYSRAGLFFSVRNWGAALEDYNRFFELSKTDQEYPRLYVWLIRARGGQTDVANRELVDYLQRRGNTADWFSTVASYLLGKISDADLLAAARSSDKSKESGQLCEAWFYAGMKKLMGGDKSEAQDCFNKSVRTDQKEYTEYNFARAELKALRN